MYYEPTRDIDDRITAYSYGNCTAALHYHETIEIIFIFKGTFLITLGQKQYMQQAATLCLFRVFSLIRFLAVKIVFQQRLCSRKNTLKK